MRFKNGPQLPGAGRTRAGHHHGSHTPTSPGAILLSKMACQPKHIGRQCKLKIFSKSCRFNCNLIKIVVPLCHGQKRLRSVSVIFQSNCEWVHILISANRRSIVCIKVHILTRNYKSSSKSILCHYILLDASHMVRNLQ